MPVRKHDYLTTEPLPFFRKYEWESYENIESTLLQAIAEFAHDKLEANACSIFVTTDSFGDNAVQLAGTGYQILNESEPAPQAPIVLPECVDENPSQESKLGVTGWILSTGLPFLARNHDELTKHKHHLGRTGKPGYVQTFLGVPIRGLEHEVIGLIKAERWAKTKKRANDIPPFSYRDECILSNLALATARCLDYLRTSFDGNPQLAINGWTSYVISLAATEEPDLSSYATVAAEMLAAAADAESCSIFLLDSDQRKKDGETNYLTQVGGHGFQAKGNRIRTYRMWETPPNESHEEGLTAYIARTGETVYAKSNEEVKNHPAHAGMYDTQNTDDGEEKLQCAAFLGIPLQIGVDTIGVVKLENSMRKEPRLDDPFPWELRRQINVIAQHLALTIWRLRNSAQSRYSVIERASETINGILSGKGKLNELVAGAIKTIAKELNAEACALFLKEGNKLVQYDWGAYGYVSKIPQGQQRQYEWVPKAMIPENPVVDPARDIDERVGLTVWMASMGKKVVAGSYEELKHHAHHRGTYDSENFGDKERGCESFIGVPLQVGDDVIGVLKIENKKNPDNQPAQFTKEDELVTDLLAASVANAVRHLREQEKTNLKDFQSKCNIDHELWALGLERNKKGLKGFSFDMPPLNDDAVVVHTLSLGICGTDINSFGGDHTLDHRLIEFHEAIGEVAWVGPKVDTDRINIGDIVVPVVRRCQVWDVDNDNPDEIHFKFRSCGEAHLCPNYRRADACPKGEYVLGGTGCQHDVGYLSRGTGKCHGFGSEFFVDTAEWLVRVCSKEELSSYGTAKDQFLSRLILVEPLAVVWKMKREIEQVRPVRPLKDKLLTLGLGPIGFLATELMCRMYPGLQATAVDYLPTDRLWINQICSEHNLKYLQLPREEKWHPELAETGERFDIVIEATGQPQHVVSKAIEVLAPNGILALLSVTGHDQTGDVDMPSNILNAVVKKNGKIIGSVNESREDFENAVEFLKTFHGSRVSPNLDNLRHNITLDIDKWTALQKVRDIKNTGPAEREHGPKIVLRAPQVEI